MRKQDSRTHYHSSRHVWQERFKAFPIQQGDHLFTVLRYIERNSFPAGLLARAEDCPQSECSGQPCIKVFVVKKTPDLLKQIPSTLEGHPVEVQETGEFRALDPA